MSTREERLRNGALIMGAFGEFLELINPSEIGEKFPIVRGMGLRPFAAAHLLNKAGMPCDLHKVKTDQLDRFMAGFNEGAGLVIRDNIPEGLSGDDLVIGKVIKGKSLNNSEKGVYDSLLSKTKELVDEFYELEREVRFLSINGVSPNWEKIRRAREKGWFDIPDPSQEELDWVKLQSSKQAGDAKPAYTIKMADIETAILDGLQQEGDNPAGFSLSSILGMLVGKDYGPARSGVIGGLVEMASGIAKTLILTDDGKVGEALKNIPNIAVDKDVEAVKGLGDLIKVVLKGLYEIRDEDDKSKKAVAIDKMAAAIKESDLLEEKEFIELLQKILEKAKERKSLSGETSAPETAAAMLSPAVAFPVQQQAAGLQLSENLESESKPSFLEKLGNLIPKRDEKEKPGFIQEAAAVPVSPPAKEEAVNAVISHHIHNAVLNKYPFIKDICDIAASNGVSLMVTPIMENLNGSSDPVMVAIQVEATVNGAVSPSKSFTIDIGQVLDSRMKVFANRKASGFFYLENCNEAFNLFAKNGKEIDKAFFTKVFKVGFDGLNEADKKESRMYNSNTMQLNRVIIFRFLPTWEVKGEMRQALKDSAFKMMRQIKEMNRLNGIDLGRFTVSKFDKEEMSYVLTNDGTYFNGKLNTAPRMQILVCILTDAKGNPVKDENGKPRLNYFVEFVDNVFDKGFKYPTGAVLMDATIGTKASSSPKEEEIKDAEFEELEDDEVPSYLKV